MKLNNFFIQALAKFTVDEVTNFTGYSVIASAAPDKASEELREHLEHKYKEYFKALNLLNTDDEDTIESIEVLDPVQFDPSH